LSPAAAPARKAARPAPPGRAQPAKAAGQKAPRPAIGAGAPKPKPVSRPGSSQAVPAAAPVWQALPDETPLDAPAPVLGTSEPFWGANDGPHRPRWASRHFFQGRPAPEGVPFAVRFASPLRLAGVFAVIGFFAVFVNQATLLLQIVVGAPVFEELLKFGVALLIVGVVPRLGKAYPVVVVLRVAVAWAVGAGFGWLEHWITYSAEPFELYVGRILFHGGASALSMATYCVLEGASDVRLRWFATAPATVLHYANNVGAIALIAVPGIGLAYAAAVTAAVYAALLVLPAGSRWWRPSLEAWSAARWSLRPPVAPEDWQDARGRRAAAATAPPPAARVPTAARAPPPARPGPPGARP
jgi:hypothetical protein